MKKFVMSSLLALSSTLAFVGMSQASAVEYSATQASGQMQEQGERCEHRRGGHYRGAMAQLNLTDAQKAQIDAIRQAQRDKHQNERTISQAEHEQRREQMQTLMNSPTLNTTVLNNLANEHAEQAKQRFIERTQTQHAIAQVLTDEQRAQLEQLRDERGEHHTGQRGMHGGNR